MLGKKGGAGGAAGGGGEQHGILEGISSLHSWIKTQTMIRPQPRAGRGGGKLTGLYDEVIISSLPSKSRKLFLLVFELNFIYTECQNYISLAPSFRGSEVR